MTLEHAQSAARGGRGTRSAPQRVVDCAVSERARSDAHNEAFHVLAHMEVPVPPRGWSVPHVPHEEAARS